MSRSTVFALALALTSLTLTGAAFAGDHCPPQPTEEDPDVALPGDFFFPEGIDHTADGTFFVSSLPTGVIATFEAGDASAQIFSQGVLTGAVGVYVDEPINTLWVCGTREVEVAPGVIESQNGVQGFDLDTAAPVAFHVFSDGGFCNDIAQDQRGNLYVTDSAGWRIMSIDADDRLSDSPAELWLQDPRFALEPGEGTGLSLNGIAFSRWGRWLYVVNITRGELYKIKVRGNGQPGQIRTVALDRPLNGPDGIEVIDQNTLIAAENFTNTLSFVELNGHRGEIHPYVDGVNDSPATLTIYDDQLWVTVSQLDRLFLGNPNPPSLPFMISTIPMP